MPAKKQTVCYRSCATCGARMWIIKCRINQVWCSKKCRSRTPEERFWSFVEVGADNECWEWNGTRNQSGAGRFNPSPDNRGMLASHYSWELNRGEIPDGMQVLHSCDNPPCVNPKHLFLGTHYDNMTDRDSKGRQARGDKIRTTKLKPSDIPEIRRLRKCEFTASQIGQNYGVCDQTIFDILRGKNWKYVA